MRNTWWLRGSLSIVCLTPLAACSDAVTELAHVDAEDAGSDDDDDPKPSRDAGRERDSTDPVITILSPREGSAVDERRFVVTGKVTDDVGVTKLSYAVGSAAAFDVSVSKDGDFSFELVPVPGENTVTVTARDAAGNASTRTRSAYFGHRLSGGNSQFAMLADGKLFTWGRNELGQLGNGTLIGNWSEDPTVMLPRMYEQAGSDLVSIVSRQNNMIALAKDGTIKTWGANDAGQLGSTTPANCGSNGTTPCGRTPAAVPGVSDAVAVAAGFGHSLVLKADGTVLAFGRNDKGQLGLPSVASSATPTPVPGLSDVIAIGAGSSHSLALTSQGKVLVWGSNQYGTLGNGTTDTTAHPNPTEIPNLSDVASIASGNDTMVVRKKDGTVMAWGRNNNGQVGGGTTGDVLTPTTVLVKAGVPLTNIESIAADGLVSLAIDRDGKGYAWGAGSLGQLGQGYTSTGDRDLAPRSMASPIYVAPGSESSFVLTEIDVAAGGSTMAFTTEKKLYAWGWSFQGSLGGGNALLNTWAYTTPILVYPTLTVPKP